MDLTVSCLSRDKLQVLRKKNKAVKLEGVFLISPNRRALRGIYEGRFLVKPSVGGTSPPRLTFIYEPHGRGLFFFWREKSCDLRRINRLYFFVVLA